MPGTRSKDYTLEREKSSEVDKRIEAQEIPVYMERLELSEEQKKRIVDEILEELEEIIAERETEHMDDKDDALDRQYEGVMQEDERRQFNLNRRVTKIKVDKVTSLIMQAIFDSDPKISVSPRPEFAREGGQDICDSQSDYLDYSLDNLPFRAPFGMAVHSGVLKGLGYLKLFHEIEQVDRRREERYAGIVYGKDESGNNVVIDDQGLKEFLTNYPDADKRYPGLVKDIMEGKEINIISKYKETIYNDPMPRCVNKKDLYVRKSAEGYHGMKSQKLLAERKTYQWWELEKLERNEQFYDIDKLTYEAAKQGAESKRVKKYKNKEYEIFECSFFTKLKESDEDYTRGIFWINKEKKLMIGSILYPYFSVDCVYFPIIISKKKAGLYQAGVGEDLTDTNIAESAILNFVLEGAYISNMVTPIVEKDSELERQFLEKRWAHGIPLNAKAGQVDFLQKYMKPPDIQGLLLLMQQLLQTDDDVSRVSSLMSGRETPLDPTAPAQKTLALLQQSGIGVKDYIETMAPCINEIFNAFLQMQYQMSKEGRKYKPRTQAVVGRDPFKSISRNAMVARTNIQTQAVAFDFDKQNEKREDLALYQVLRQELLIARNPNAVYAILKNIIKSWSPKWKNNIDTILPPLEEFQKEQVMTALKALALYAQQKQQDAQITGLPQEMKAEEFLPMMNDMVAMIATPPDKEAIKAQEANA